MLPPVDVLVAVVPPEALSRPVAAALAPDAPLSPGPGVVRAPLELLQAAQVPMMQQEATRSVLEKVMSCRPF